jgi:hypothetical protein
LKQWPGDGGCPGRTQQAGEELALVCYGCFESALGDGGIGKGGACG